MVRAGQLKGWVCALALSCVLIGSAPAQTADTGALSGTVTDPSSGVIPAATVSVINSETGQVRTALTGASGVYNVSLLPPGTYKVTFSAEGFRTTDVEGVRIDVADAPVLNRRLELGVRSDQITVESQEDILQTASSSLGMVVGRQSVEQLPLTNRNYTQILSLAAGVNASVNNASAAGNGSQDVSVNGMDPSHNNYQMDGVSITPIAGGNTQQGLYPGIGIPNPDAIAEFKIQTSLYDAGFGRNPGANVNVVTKSGTNAWHGTGFEFFRNTALNANGFFQNRSGSGKSVLNQNQFGGVVGGPLRKDKLFIFGSYQGTRQKNSVDPAGNTTGATLPPIPSGDRSAASFQKSLGQAFCNDPTFTQRIGLGGVQVACDGSNINPVALAILRLKNPNGTYYIPGSPTGRYATATFTDPVIFSEEQYLANVDYLLNSRHTIAGRYFGSTEHQLQGFNCLVAPETCLPGSGQDNHFRNTEAVLKLTSVLTNNVVHEARASFQRNESVWESRQRFTDSQVGITPVTPGINSLAPITILGQFDSGGSTEPDFNVSNQFQWADQISWNRGRHSIRAGGEFERVQWPWVFPGLSKGFLLFQTFPDFLLGLPGCAPGTFPVTCNGGIPGATNGTPFSNIIATLLAVRAPETGVVHGYRINNANLFVQDDVRVAANLTLNVGLRWEYDGELSDKYGNLTNIWLSQIQKTPTPGTSSANGTYSGFVIPANFRGTAPSGVLVNSKDGATRTGTPLNNFAPRIGFAWQPGISSRLVVRGGYGWFYDRVFGNSLIHAVESSPPYALTLDNSGPALGYASLANPYPNQPLGWGDTRWVDFRTGASSNLNYPFLQEDFVTPLVQSYNLNLQYRFAPDWVFEVGYAGSHGIHLVNSGRQVNLAQLASPSHPINGITTNTIANESLRVPYLGFAPNGLQQSGSDGDMKYNSLQVNLSRRMSHGLQFHAAYTFARAFTTLQANGIFGLAGVNSNSNDPGNTRQQYGLNAGYRPQRLVVNYTWDIPIRSRSTLAGRILSNWTLAGVTTVQNGQPLTVNDSRGGTIYCGGCQASFSNVVSRAQMAAGVTYADVPTQGSTTERLGGVSGGPGFINVSAFGNIPTVGDGTIFGNSGIGILQGPGQINVDASVLRSFRVRENAAFQFRSEFFNLLNHPQFSNPVSTDVSQPNFGWITGTSVNPRVIQFALKYLF